MSFKPFADFFKSITANKKVVLAAKIVLTVIFIYILVVKIDLPRVKSLLVMSDKFLLFIALIFCALAQVAASWRLQSFLGNIGINVGFLYNLKLYVLGMFYNIFLPGGIGGDGVKVYIVQKKYKTGTKPVLLATIFDRLSGLWAISILGLILLIMIPQANVPRQYPLLLMVAGTIVYRVISVKYFRKYSQNFVITHFKALLVQGLQLLCVCLILLSLDFQGKFSPYLLSYLLAGLIGIINIGFGGFGVRDLAMSYSSEMFDVDSTTGVFLTLASSLLQIIISLPGIYYTYQVEELAEGEGGN